MNKLNTDLAILRTPFFFYNESIILRNHKLLNSFAQEIALKILFSIKSFSIYDGLRFIAPLMDGFGVSSLFEAKLAREVLGDRGSVHTVTPGYKPSEIEEIAELSDYITFNSIPQWNRFLHLIQGRASCGVRVNPQLSYIEDSRYDPCRKYSKLGIPVNQLVDVLKRESWLCQEIKGIHFHSNSESETYAPLLETVKHLDNCLPKLLSSVHWINLGGGYYINNVERIDALYEAVDLLKAKYGVDVFIEPGQGVVEEAGYIVSSVIDIFESDDKNIAVLDTTVNHMPEVFEYQYRPDISQASKNGTYEYILAGATCLAGDVFGAYRFEEPLEVGSRIVFENMGAYTLVKASMFNGVNLPDIYAYTLEGNLEHKKVFRYEEYLTRCGATEHATI